MSDDSDDSQLFHLFFTSISCLQRLAQAGEESSLGSNQIALGLQKSTTKAEESSLDSLDNVDDGGEECCLGTNNASNQSLNVSIEILQFDSFNTNLFSCDDSREDVLDATEVRLGERRKRRFWKGGQTNAGAAAAVCGLGSAVATGGFAGQGRKFESSFQSTKWILQFSKQSAKIRFWERWQSKVELSTTSPWCVIGRLGLGGSGPAGSSIVGGSRLRGSSSDDGACRSSIAVRDLAPLENPGVSQPNNCDED